MNRNKTVKEIKTELLVIRKTCIQRLSGLRHVEYLSDLKAENYIILGWRSTWE